MGQEPDREYAKLKEFLSFYTGRYFNVEGLPPGKRPMANLEILEKKSKKTALKGLRQAINDCIEMSFYIDLEEVIKLDQQLRDRGVITLSELRRRYSKKYASIVKRGLINNETEYYLIRNVLGDSTTKTTYECEVLKTLIANYERTWPA
jgi:hypothetical protein